jgi:hypothetical protein
MTQQELNLFKLPSSGLAQPGTCAAQIMGRKTCHTYSPRRFLHDVPDGLFRKRLAPWASAPADPAKDPALLNSGSSEPHVKFMHDPVGNRHGAHVSAFADQIDDCPMILALLEILKPKPNRLVPAQSARQEQ